MFAWSLVLENPKKKKSKKKKIGHLVSYLNPAKHQALNLWNQIHNLCYISAAYLGCSISQKGIQPVTSIICGAPGVFSSF